jgi:hypothetical protein
MIGWVIEDEPEFLWPLVNQRLSDRGEFTNADHLQASSPIGSCCCVYQSTHQRVDPGVTIRLTHLFFDVRGRPPLPAGQLT